MKALYMIICLLVMAGRLDAQHLVQGKITNYADRSVLPGVSLQITGTDKRQLSDHNGAFSFVLPAGSYTLIVFHVGFEKQSIDFKVPVPGPLNIELTPAISQLKEVAVLSNGYQKLARGKTTGSFVQLDSAILNRRVSPDILSRLEDVTPGLIFNRGRASGANNISIRGRSTLFANDQPLIILDNFPYEGDLNAINPNDVESVTVLKDAAASAIWGARSGNGVIVITTRSGAYNQKTKVSLNTNFTYGAKPDLFYYPQMSVPDYIEMEKTLFASGFYNTKELSGNQDPLSPVVELLIAGRDGKITNQQALSQIEQLKAYDVRNDYKKYLYQNTQAQQYALQISGGTAGQKYLLSAGYDKGLASLVGNSNNRLSLRGSNTYLFNKGKGELGTEVYFIKSRAQTNNPGTSRITMGTGVVYPYARLADDFGNPLTVTHDYRQQYVDGAKAKGLLDWGYNPLQEIALADQNSEISDLRLNSRFKYTLFTGLTGELLYQYTRSNSVAKNLQGLESYYTRNLINVYTQVNTEGSFNRAIPVGAIQDLTTGLSTGNSLRAQLNYQRRFATDHELNAIGGYEVRSQESMTNYSRLYGFDSLNGTNLSVDYLGNYRSYFSAASNSLRVPFADRETAFSDRYISWYSNIAYTFKQRYTFTGSARLDRSNIFGVKTNQKGVPLYSAGLSWNMADEDFYHLDWMPSLKLRSTFGYNGNVDKSLSAVTTATFRNGAGTETNLPYANISNPPNPDLRWERVRIFNLGLDFSLHKQMLSGSIDVYQKKGIDLIGSTTMPSSSGVNIFRGNTANTKGKGIDLVLNTKQEVGSFKWYSSFLLSYVKDKVIKYGVIAITDNYLEGGAEFSYPYLDRPLGALYSYPWAGLDAAIGDPQGYLNGKLSKDYASIVQNTTPTDLIYHGPSRPPVFGAYRNTFEYKNFSIGVNISYRLGYYFRRNSVLYSGVLSGQGGHGDYSKRWKKPGDETITDVPSFSPVRNLNRDRLYTYSSALVEKGDHIRMQDINLGYAMHRSSNPLLPFASLRFYVYANNIGLLWRANKQGLDPDYPSATIPRTISAGLKADF